MQPEQTSAGDGMDAGAVLRFLSANPAFFDEHREVLSDLVIPHASGGAVSLIERQVSVLREKCASLEHHLHDLIDVAQANEQLQTRLHALVQDIITADSLAAVIDATRVSLCENFGADAVHVLLAGQPAGEGYRHCAASAFTGAPFAELFESGSTRCGLPLEAELALLVDAAEQADVGSAAVLPLSYEGTLGVVLLSSRDESRFAAGKGVIFLDQLGSLLSRRLHAFRVDRNESVRGDIETSCGSEEPVSEIEDRTTNERSDDAIAATCRLPA